MTLGYMSGPLLIAWLGSAPEMMALPGAMFAIAGALVLFNARKLPDLPLPSSPFSRTLLFSMPLLAAAAFVSGIAEEVPLALGAVWGLRSGWSEGQIVAAIFAFALGGACGQLPAGWTADKLGPKRVLFAVAAACTLIPLLLLTQGGPGPVAVFLFFLWGASAFPIYTVSLSVLGRQTGREDLARANGLYIVCFSAGVAIGPPTVGLGVEQLGPDFFLLALAAVPLVFLAGWLLAGRAGRAC